MQTAARIRISDVAVTGVVLGVALGALAAYPEEPGFRSPDALAVVLTVGQGLPLLVSRSWPLGSFLGSWASTIGYLSAGYPPFTPVWLATIVATFALALRAPSRSGVAGGAFSIVLVFVLAIGGSLGDVAISSAETGLVALLFVGAAALGHRVRVRRDLVEDLRRRAAEEEAERERRAMEAVSLERTRIARELHDVIAHGLSVIVVQAEGAQDVMGADPDRARRALEVIEATAREALGELRTTLDVLRMDSASFERHPTPGLSSLPGLVADLESSGLTVRVRWEEGPVALPAGVDLSAYRVVQEALTNVLRHSSAKVAQVTLAIEDEALAVRVTDPGPARKGSGGSGYGLVGMRERVGLFGGSMQAGPLPDGGFQVVARFPLQRESM